MKKTTPSPRIRSGPQKGTRSLAEQRIHDFVIIRLANILATTYPDSVVHSNFGSMKSFGVCGQYPDIVVCHGPNDGEPFHLYEIETIDSLNLRHAQQWKNYASLGPPFTLVVPLGARDAAIELLVELGRADIEVLTFCVLPGEQVVIN